MALNSTGPISIGGSTTGQSINLELGRAATATSSLNETSLRSLAGVASGAISLSNFYGKSNVSWSPAGGPSGAGVTLSDEAAGGDDAIVTITCNQSASWTWFKSGDPAAFASIASGGSSADISFILPNSGFTIKNSSFSVSSTAGGVTQYWTVNLTNDGFA